jgi:hypothetical protein
MHGVHNLGNLSGSHIGIVQDVNQQIRISKIVVCQFVIMKLYQRD